MILDEIVADKEKRLIEIKKQIPLSEQQRLAEDAKKQTGREHCFLQAL